VIQYSNVRGDNRQNTSGLPPTLQVNKTCRVINNAIVAGATLPLPISGDQFYILTASGQIQIRPSNGVFNPYDVGTGLKLSNDEAFTMLEIKNETAEPVAFSLFVGFQEFIDKRLITINPVTPQVIHPVYDWQQGGDYLVEIPDLSGQVFLDQSGAEWYAIQRVKFLIHNFDTTMFYRVVGPAALSQLSTAVAVVYPYTTEQIEASGDFRIYGDNSPQTDAKIVVSDIYQAIPKT
jgi:hypothetical protein